MLETKKIQSSPSRTYVCICINSHFDGHYFRKFYLPPGVLEEGYETEGPGTGTWSEGSVSRILPNTAATATWYFGNKLNFQACYLYAIPVEQFCLEDQDAKNEETKLMLKESFPNDPGYKVYERPEAREPERYMVAP